MSLSISKNIFDTDDRVARLRTFLGALMEGLLDGGNVFVRHIVSLGGVLEETCEVGIFTLNTVFVDWLYVANNSGELSSSTRLLLM